MKYILKIWNTIKLLYGKENVDFIYVFKGSFVATNNPSGFNCFCLNKSKWNDMWILDKLYLKIKDNDIWRKSIKVDLDILIKAHFLLICDILIN